MALNKAVISTNCPTGPKEILEQGKSGILVDVGDYREMGSQMMKLSLDNKLREKYEKKGKESIKRFSIKTVIIEYRNMILEI